MEKRPRHTFWLRWLGRAALAALLLFLLLWLFSPWIVGLTSLQSAIQSYAGEQLGGELRFDSLGLTLTGGLSLTQMTYRPYAENKASLELQVERAQIHSFYSSNISTSLHNLTLRTVAGPVLSASRVDGIIHNAWEKPSIEAELNRGSLDVERVMSLRADSPSPQSGTVTMDRSWLHSLRFNDLLIPIPAVKPDYIWNGTVRPGDEPSQWIVSLHAMDEPFAFPENLRAGLVWDASENRLLSLGTDLINFHLDYNGFGNVSWIASGQVKVDRGLDGLPTVKSYMQLNPLVVNIPGIASFDTDKIVIDLPSQVMAPARTLGFKAELANAQISLSTTTIQTAGFSTDVTTELNENWMPETIESRGAHEHLRYGSDDAGYWAIPAGAYAADIHMATTADIPVSLDWSSDAIGRIAIQSASWPFDASSPLTVNFQFQNKPIAAVASILPASMSEILRDASGMISLHGNAQLLGTTLQKYSGTIGLASADWSVGPVRISDASLGGPLKGSLTGHDVQLQGNAHLSVLLSDNGTLELDPDPLKVLFRYSMKDKNFWVKIPKTNADPFENVAFSFASPDVWEVTGTLDAETGLPPLAKTFLPDVTRTLESAGQVDLHMKGKGSEFAVSGRTDDLAIFSFAEDPAIGVQLRDVRWNMNTRPLKNGMRLFNAIKGVTPYFTYAGNDVEWPAAPLVLEATITTGNNAGLQVRASPPGGGELRISRQGEKPYRLDFRGLNVREFALPLVENFALASETDDATPFLSADGTLSGWLQVDTDNDPMAVQGVLDFADTNLAMQGATNLAVENVQMKIPVAYPLQQVQFPASELLIKADLFSINEARFPHVDWKFPLQQSDISVAKNVSLPLFGGNIDINFINVKEWQSSAAELLGRLALRELSLRQLNAAYPYLLDEGTLSGEIEELRVSREVISASGVLRIQVFGGDIWVKDLQVRDPFGFQRVVGMTMELDKIDLKRLTDYFEYGEMTGLLSGTFSQMEIELPASGSDDFPRPIRFNIELQNTGKKYGVISREALNKLVNLGEASGLAQSLIDRDRYYFTHLGLRAALKGDDLHMYGTGPDGYFLYANQSMRFLNPRDWFDIPVSIKLAEPDEIIQFPIIWQRLLSQVGNKGE